MPIGIDDGHQVYQGRIAPVGDFFQRGPERILEAARPAASNNDRAFEVRNACLTFGLRVAGQGASQNIFCERRSHFGLVGLAAMRAMKAQGLRPDAVHALAIGLELKINFFPCLWTPTSEIVHGAPPFRADQD
jgi:hypothetical protein